MAGRRRNCPRIFRSMLFTLTFKGFRKKNFIFLFLVAGLVVFQVVIVSRVLLRKSDRQIVDSTAINSTDSTVRVKNVGCTETSTEYSHNMTSLSSTASQKSHVNRAFGKAKNRKFRKKFRERSNRVHVKGNHSELHNETLQSARVPPTLDYRMLHEYYPPVNFSLVEPHVVPRFDDNKIFLLVMVNTATKRNPNAELRQAVRKTWAKTALANVPGYGSSIKHGFPFKTMINHSFKLVFLMGKSGDRILDLEIEEEARRHNDLVIGDFHDNYNNLIIKVFMGFVWAQKMNCKFILKADDDTYIYLPRLMMMLDRAPDRFFGGYVINNAIVYRDMPDKHAISKMYYSATHYPPYCGGGFYVLTHNLIPEFLTLTKKFRPFHVEDAYLGVLLREMGMRPLFIPGFHLSNWMFSSIQSFQPCDWATAIALGHMFNRSHIEFIHSKLPMVDPSRLSAQQWQACRRTPNTTIPDNMLPAVYGIILSLAMILVYVLVAFLPSQYEYEDYHATFRRRRQHYYPYVYR